MRAIAWILLGLLIGIFAGTSAYKALRAHTALQRGLMQTTGFHLGQLREASKTKDCLTASAPHRQALALLAHDIKPAFGEFVGQDEVFVGYADKLITATEHARDNPGADCEALAAAIGPIKDACQACHRDYKP